ncbi:PREDICTED: pickpocket protein 28 [Drosophila arizonae]|uniref:Pickpocket protein 28 n=1 Tax=Drosophila arizonae TaxID=7263 RepID=A0ABM1Q1I7_DROAR|nr:PREDICTED: pickpocket protein 28 [Drosophila arizonae]
MKQEKSRVKTNWKAVGWRFVDVVTEYCQSCSLAGFSYMANHNLHFTERLFWLLCIIVSTVGVYHLISQYQRDFTSRAVSIVHESLSPFAKVKFPTISVCELRFKTDFPRNVEEYVESLGTDLNDPYNWEVESYLSFVLFPYQYTTGMFVRCQPYEQCEKCAKCPKTDYRNLSLRFGFNCSDLFIRCTLADKEFDCCTYFLPMITPFGRCFLFNSLQNNHPESKHWLPAILDRSSHLEMDLHLTRAALVSVLNEEDVPNIPLPTVDVIVLEGQHKTLQFHRETMVNDPGMKDIPIAARDCYFPDEVMPWSMYKAYSFSACISDCTRLYQMELCNCSVYNMSPYPDPRYPDCDFNGYLCLESSSMVKQDVKRLFRINSPTLHCHCLPSCTEGDLKSIFEDQISSKRNVRDTNVTLLMPVWPTDQYRRQVLRSKLDVVVSIGGILGLFLGASILSAIEFVYHFTLRAANTSLMARRELEQAAIKFK